MIDIDMDIDIAIDIEVACLLTFIHVFIHAYMHVCMHAEDSDRIGQCLLSLTSCACPNKTDQALPWQEIATAVAGPLKQICGPRQDGQRMLVGALQRRGVRGLNN